MFRLLPRRRHLWRASSFGLVLAAMIAAAFVLSAREAGLEGPAERPFRLEGWEYGRILPPGAPERYRLRVEVARAVASPERDEAPSEFRLLLERRDDSNFTCLRWTDGDLELVRIAGGERAHLLGRVSYPLACIARTEPRQEVPRKEALVVDRAPGTWAVAYRGRELIVAGDPHPTGATEKVDFAWGSDPGWTLSSRALQPVEDVHFEDGFAKASFNEDGVYDVREGLWDLDAARQAERSVNAFRLRGRSRPAEDGAAPGMLLLGRSFWRGYRAEAAIEFRNEGAAGLVFAARRRAQSSGDEVPPLERYGLLRWRCDRGADGPPGRLDVLDVRVGNRADGGPSRRETTLLSLPCAPRRE